MEGKFQKQNGWLIALLALTTLASAIVGIKIAYPSSPIVVFIHTNGVASVYGIPLGNKVVRRLVFTAIKTFKPADAEVGISIPANVSITGLLTNLPMLDADLKRAGLSSPPKPNPYE